MKTILCKSEDDSRFEVLKALTALTCAVVMQSLLTFGEIELPQKKGSLFSLISDDTRMVVSSSLMQKADDYFHGGVKAMDCTLESHAAEALGGEHDCDHDHDHSHCHDHDHDYSHHQISLMAVLKNPFLWINSQVHSQEHRHLENERSVELLPWVSAAVMASPHNIQAYESGSYILNRMTNKPELAIKFLEQGIKNNPENVSLELSLVEIYFNAVENREKAVFHLNKALKKSLAKEEKTTKDDLFERLRIYYYFGVVAKDNHDVKRLESLYQNAFKIDQISVMTRTILRWLNEEKAAQKE